jgi:translocation and assembly module TamB
LKRLLRVALAVGATLIAVAALVTGGTMVFLRSPWGGRVVRGWLVPRVNARIAGRLSLGRLDMGGGTIRVEGVELDDPEGAVVVRVGALQVEFSLLALLRREVAISSVLVERPSLVLREDARGWNLSRALASRAPPRARRPSGERSEWRVATASLRVEGGVVEVVRDELSGGSQEVRLDALRAAGSGRFDAGAVALDASLRLSGHVPAPRGGPLSLEIAARGRGGGGSADLRAELPPEVVRVLVPAFRAKAPIEVRASVTGAGTRGRSSVDVTDAGALVHADVAFDAAARAVEALDVRGRHVDLGAAVEGLPRSDLAFEVTGRASGHSAEDLGGELRFELARGTLGGHDVGPVKLDASAAHGTLRVTTLSAALPGATLDARGTASRHALALGFDVVARDLGAASRSLEPLVPAGLSGAGRLHIRIGGSPAAPSLSVEGRFASLAVAGTSASALGLRARWSDLRRPLSGEVSARASRVRLRGHEVTDVAADLSSRGLDFKLDVRMLGRDAVALSALGRWRADRRVLSLESLELTTPEVRWEQTPRTLELAVEARHFRLRGLDLHAGQQRIRADLAFDNGRVRTTAEISQLDLQRLPRLLFPAAPPATRIDARARLDLPTRWPTRRTALPIAAEVALRVGDVGPLLRLAGVTRPPVSGGLAVDLDLGGTAAVPRLAARAELTDAVADGEKLGDLTVSVRGRDGEPTTVSARIEPAQGGGGKGSFELSTPLPLSHVLANPPTVSALMRTPFEATGNVQNVPLGLLARLGGRDGLRGTAGARLSARGTSLAPTGAVEIEAHGASAPGLPPTDLRADVALRDGDLRIAARVWRTGRPPRPLAWASGVARITPAQLANLDALEQAPLDVRIGVGPLEARRRSELDEMEMEGRVRFEGSITGTARAPRASIRADADNVTVSGASLGGARATLEYADKRARLEATIGDSPVGTLRLQADAEADLGIAALSRGLDPNRWPVNVALEADHFDISWLTVIPLVRKASGALTASLHAHRAGGPPQIEGRLELAQGKLTLSGLGAYENVHLALHADAHALTVDELAAESAGGHARVAGALSLAGTNEPLRLTAKLDKFPVYGRGQILGRVSASASVIAKLGARTLDAQVKMPDAHLEIAKIESRKVQSLDRPGDIIILENGRPEGGKAAGSAAGPRPFISRILVDAPRNVWVHGPDANVELGFAPGFRVEAGAETKVYGRIVVLRGRVDVLGRKFDLQAGSRAEFTGLAAKPVLDVTAKYLNESSNVTVVVTLKGPMDALAINVNSPGRPDLSETQLYTLIATGRLDLNGTAGAPGSVGSTAGSLVGGALAGALQKAIAPRVPLDVFSFETSDGLTGARLEAGRNLGSKLYLGYVGRTGANPALLQNRNAVHLEYQFTSRWSVDAEYGDVGTGTADLFWTKRY